MSEPLVCAIMLTKDRPEMARRAVESFRAQTYWNKCLFVLADSPATAPATDMMRGEFLAILSHSYVPRSIGSLRNLAVSGAAGQFKPDIFIHFDDDDYSHPSRIEEQVAHLQSSGADVVGFNELLFWREGVQLRPDPSYEWDRAAGEAWLYKHRTNAPGTTLCYWRKTFERKPFPDLNNGEDYHWLQGLKVAAVPGFGIANLEVEPNLKGRTFGDYFQPRMIASIHGGNTLPYDIEGQIERGSREWKRIPNYDAYCSERLKL